MSESYIKNPKLINTNIWDCIPQSGKCSINCNQCYFNRPNAFYTKVPNIPDPDDVDNGLVRLNSGNDSNNQKQLVIETALKYKNFFFNTSLPNLEFPGPVVLTANPREEENGYCPYEVKPPNNLMFVRLRISATNLELINRQVSNWTDWLVPIVFTFMSYYNQVPKVPEEILKEVGPCYEWKVRHINSYWCPTKAFIKYVMDSYKGNRLVSYCGSLDDPYCRSCRNCETYYIQTMKRLRGE